MVEIALLLPKSLDMNDLCVISGFVYDGTGCTDRKFPLLEEVFKEFPETPINLDIKVDDDELIEKVMKINWIRFCNEQSLPKDAF